LSVIIGFSGKIGTGKTTLARKLRLFKYAPDSCVVMSFGDIIKKDLQDYYDIPTIWLYDHRFKNEKIVNPANFKQRLYDKICELTGRSKKYIIPPHQRKYLITKYNPDIPYLPRYNMTVREVMQWWGNDYKRKQYPDYVVNKFEVQLKENIEQDKNIIIDDIRYENEANLVKKYNGKIVRIHEYPGYDIKFNSHEAESSMDKYNKFDYHIFPKFGELDKHLIEIDHHLLHTT
jgi:hypothetical protein